MYFHSLAFTFLVACHSLNFRSYWDLLLSCKHTRSQDEERPGSLLFEPFSVHCSYHFFQWLILLEVEVQDLVSEILPFCVICSPFRHVIVL